MSVPAPASLSSDRSRQVVELQDTTIVRAVVSTTAHSAAGDLVASPPTIKAAKHAATEHEQYVGSFRRAFDAIYRAIDNAIVLHGGEITHASHGDRAR